MSTSNRAAKLTKTHKVLKKHYKPCVPADRSVLEHLLYACCLEFTTPDVADEVFAKLQQAYYDWNEVRVTTVSELAEVMTTMNKSTEAASRLKRTLQSIFESYYSFDLEALKKENIGKAVKQLQRLDGVSDFAIAIVTQNSLNGHAIAVNDDALEVFRILGVISDDELKKRRVPGLERAIAKSKGVEFASLMHQLSADYGAAPFSPRVRSILLEISPDAKNRFPKRGSRKKSDQEVRKSHKRSKPASAKREEDRSEQAKKKPPSKTTRKKSAPAKKTAAETKKKSTTKRLTKKKPR
jgi:endonuclease-3